MIVARPKKFLMKINADITRGHSGPENLKKFRPKKFVKSNKSISRKNFLKVIHKITLRKYPQKISVQLINFI